jgi:hypothetical protein
MVSVVLRIKNTWVLDMCCVYGLISESSWLFLWFLICGLGQVSFWSLVNNFLFSNSYVSVIILGLDLNKFTLPVVLSN